MNKILGKVGVKISPKAKNKLTERDLIKAESKIGSTLFGPVPEGHRRESFAWIAKPGFGTKNGKRQGRTESVTTRYEVRPNGVMKIQDGHKYTYIHGNELHNLAKACQLYYQHVSQHVYGQQNSNF